MLCACATMGPRDPIQAYVVGVQPLAGEGLELRMLVRLRVQNPNDTPLEYHGVAIDMDVQGRRFASGVSDVAGRVPRFGETVIEVPVSISAMRLARSAYDVFGPSGSGTLHYELDGKLAGSAFRSVRFTSRGELVLPHDLYESTQPSPK
ncbi:MAG: water stress/hypersensitive response domain-containing protein [Proteobacteria bacterium]|nr:MAG: water stress/hypersensitive response domain-containing protein [Pseudomonadota bacterium]